MRAAVTTRYGRPEVVEVREVPTPTPADNEVLVRVRASSVCFGDRILRSGPLLIRLLSGFRPRHSILGVDLAGTVETVGPGVTRFAPGDAVYGARGNKFAAHAEFACVADDGFLARKPATMTFEEAGTVFVGAQLARAEARWTLSARRLFRGTLGIARALVTGGVVHLRGRARFVTGAADPKQADLVFLQELIDAGKLRTVIGRRYGLDEIAEAHRYADTGHKIGNVAVLIRDQTEHSSP